MVSNWQTDKGPTMPMYTNITNERGKRISDLYLERVIFRNQMIFLNPKETLNVPDNTHVADFDNSVCLARVLRRAIHMMILYLFSDLIEHGAYKANKFWDTIVKVDMPMINERYLLIGNIGNSKSFLMNMQEGVDNTDASQVSSLSDTVTEHSVQSCRNESDSQL